MSNRGLLRLIALPALVPVLMLWMMMLRAAPVHADTTTTVTEPFPADAFSNVCSTPADEVVVFGGALHETISSSFDPFTGKIHSIWMQHSSDLRGTGISGTPYVVSQTSNVNEELNPSGTSSDTTTFHENVISQGRMPNFTLHTTVHMTFNESQGTTASVSDVRTSCP